MIADWVPAHRRLMKGPKKEVPRALRFVLLELSLEARPGRGVIDLPLTWNTVRAVQDLLGGNRREVTKALAIFQKPDETGTQTIKIVRDQSQHKLVITKWEEWAGPKSSTERVREHRENKRLGQAVTFHGETNETPTVQDRTRQNKTGESAPARAHVTQDSSPEAERAHASDLNGAAEHETESGFDLAKRVWLELWRKKYRRDYEFGPDTGKNSDDRILQRIGNKAFERANSEPYLRHKFAAYLKDHGDRNWLDEKAHPLRTLERDWVSYGEPKAPRPIASTTPVEEPKPSKPFVPLKPVSDRGPDPRGPKVITRDELAAKARDDKARLEATYGNGKP